MIPKVSVTWISTQRFFVKNLHLVFLILNAFEKEKNYLKNFQVEIYMTAIFRIFICKVYQILTNYLNVQSFLMFDANVGWSLHWKLKDILDFHVIKNQFLFVKLNTHWKILDI